MESNQLTLLVSESGLEQSKASAVTQTLKSFFDHAAEWSSKATSLEVKDHTDIASMQMARAGRLGLRTKRLEAEKLVKEKREQVKVSMSEFTLEDKLWLRAGQMMEATFKHLETILEDKEKFAERWEAEQKAKRKAERELELQPYAEFVPSTIGLADMTDEDFGKLLNGAKMQHQAKLDAEAKAEAERIEQARKEAEERERIRVENERLRAEAEERERQLEKERAENEAKLRAEREERERIEAEHRKKAEAERIERERLQAEIRAKEEADRKAKADADAKAKAEEKARIDAEKKAKAAPDKEKLLAYANSVEALALPEVKSDEAQAVVADIKTMLERMANHIRSKASLL